MWQYPADSPGSIVFVSYITNACIIELATTSLLPWDNFSRDIILVISLKIKLLCYPTYVHAPFYLWENLKHPSYCLFSQTTLGTTYVSSDSLRSRFLNEIKHVSILLGKMPAWGKLGGSQRNLGEFSNQDVILTPSAREKRKRLDGNDLDCKQSQKKRWAEIQGNLSAKYGCQRRVVFVWVSLWQSLSGSSQWDMWPTCKQ